MPVLYEMRVFPADEHGDTTGKGEFTLVEPFRDINAARRRAGGLAKKHNGPVDLAYASGLANYNNEDWDDRYITTAAPSPHHSAGYRFERLT